MEEFNKKLFGDRLRSKRAERDLTQKQLAEVSKVSVATIVSYESDDGYEPGAENIWKLACALKCDPSWLLGWGASPE